MDKILQDVANLKCGEDEFEKKVILNSRALFGLSKDYTIAFVVNLDTDEYQIVFTQETNNARRNNSITRFSDYVRNYADTYTTPEFRESIIREMDVRNIAKRFETESDYYFVFESIPNQAGQSNFQAHIVKEYDDGEHFAFLGFRSIDDVVKQEREYREKLKRANDALLNQLQIITSAIPGGIKISYDDSKYSFKYVSDQFAHMLGYETPDELTSACGACVAGLVHPDDLESGIAEALAQYEKADYYEITYRMRCKDGSYKYVEDRGQKVISTDGTIEHWNLILDKNDLMEKTIALETEKRANKSKSDFLSRMSHDMRTPLNGIIGLLHIDEDHFEDAELVKKNHEKMQVSANHLLGLINDVLQMSKIEDGSVTLTHEPIDFKQLSSEIITIIVGRATEAGIKWTHEKKKDEPYPCVYGSPLHLRQIFLNIYSNCIRYNRKGGTIHTVSDFSMSDDGSVVYRWIISDTGIGMSQEFLEQIYNPFVQENGDARSSYQGNGLGMAIVKGLIDKMGGTINISSEKGVGSTFDISIPFEVADIESIPQPEKKCSVSDSLSGLKLLLAEDNELNAEIAKMMLEDEKAEITVVGNGLDAVNLFKDNPEGTFDAILMDIMMPVMDGLEATSEIRKLSRPDAKKIPIIAMTANAFKEDEKTCLEAGMDAHIAKPLDMDKVKDTIYVRVMKSRGK